MNDIEQDLYPDLFDKIEILNKKRHDNLINEHEFRRQLAILDVYKDVINMNTPDALEENV